MAHCVRPDRGSTFTVGFSRIDSRGAAVRSAAESRLDWRTEVQKFAEVETRKPFDLKQSPLIRISLYGSSEVSANVTYYDTRQLSSSAPRAPIGAGSVDGMNSSKCLRHKVSSGLVGGSLKSLHPKRKLCH